MEKERKIISARQVVAVGFSDKLPEPYSTVNGNAVILGRQEGSEEEVLVLQHFVDAPGVGTEVRFGPHEVVGLTPTEARERWCKKDAAHTRAQVGRW